MIKNWLITLIPELASLPESKKQEVFGLYSKKALNRWYIKLIPIWWEMLVVYMVGNVDPIRDWFISQPNRIIRILVGGGTALVPAIVLFMFLYIVQMRLDIQRHIRSMKLE